MRLLILPCSARKRSDPEHLPADERYDGPIWHVLRAYQRTSSFLCHDLKVSVLSAKFGLIPASQPIPCYDQVMTPEQAAELAPDVIQHFTELMQQNPTDLCMALSRRYLRAMPEWEKLVPDGVTMTRADGPMGTKLQQVRCWLHGQPWSPTAPITRMVAPDHPRGTATLCGVSLQMSREKVLEHARTALQHKRHGASRFHTWFVLVDDQQVSPKWLVNLISEVPTNRFTAQRAREVLLTLGVSVERVS